MAGARQGISWLHPRVDRNVKVEKKAPPNDEPGPPGSRQGRESLARRTPGSWEKRRQSATPKRLGVVVCCAAAMPSAESSRPPSQVPWSLSLSAAGGGACPVSDVGCLACVRRGLGLSHSRSRRCWLTAAEVTSAAGVGGVASGPVGVQCRARCWWTAGRRRCSTV